MRIFAAVLFIAAMLVLAVPAQAQPVKLPAAYHGAWCATAGAEYTFRRCREYGADALIVHARLFFHGESRCVPLAVVPDRGGHFVQSSCRHIEDENSKIERALQRWRLLDNGRRLELSDADIVPRIPRARPK